MKKWCSILMVTMLLVSCFAAGAHAEANPITLNFYIASDMEQTASAIVETYNAAQSDVKVVMNTIPNDGYDDKMKVLTTGESDIDIFWVRTPAQEKRYMANGVLLDISKYVTEAGLDISTIQSTIDAVSDESGAYYGLPISGSCWMLFYNKDLFDAKGLEYPIDLTWDEYCALAAKLTSSEGDTKYWGGVAPFWTPNLGAIAAGEYLDAEEPMDITQQYMQVLHRMYIDDASHPSIAEMSMGTFDINAYFAAGNIYMMINGDWTFRLLQTEFNYAAAPLPVLSEDIAGESVGQASYLSIYKGCGYPQEAYDFIQFYTTSVEGTTIIAKQHDVPVYATAEAMAAYQADVTIPGVEYRFSSIIHPEQGTADYYSELIDAFTEEMQLYLLGESTLEAAFENFFSLREEIIAD